MDAREFDDLIARIAQASSRRTAVKGVLGGAFAGAGVAAAAEGKTRGKGKKGRKAKGKGRGVGSEHHGGNGKRTMCLCKEQGTTATPTTATSTSTLPPASRADSGGQARALVCETKTFKTRKAKRKLRNNPGSYRGPCEDATTTTSTSTSTTTVITADQER
jgi:hypothetical protein